MRSTLCQVWSSGTLWGALFEGCCSNDLSSLCGLQQRGTLPLRCYFQIRPASATNAREGGSLAPDHSCHSGDQGCSGALTGLVEGKDIEGSPIAPLPPDTRHHVGLWFPAAEGWLSAWQSLVHLQPVTMIVPGSKHFFSSLSHAPVNLMTESCTDAGKGVWLYFINNIT